MIFSLGYRECSRGLRLFRDSFSLERQKIKEKAISREIANPLSILAGENHLPCQQLFGNFVRLVPRVLRKTFVHFHRLVPKFLGG